MKNIIGLKDNKQVTSSLITITIFLILIMVCLLRLFSIKQIMVFVTLVGLILISFVFIVKETISIIKFCKSPNELIIKEDLDLIIYTNKLNRLHLKEITTIAKGANNNKIIFFEANIIIYTSDSKYIVQNIKNVDLVFDKIQELIK